MFLNDLENFKCVPASRLRRHRINQSLTRRTLHLDRSQCPAQAAIEETLSSALLASDVELDQILHEVDEISKKLKGDAPDRKTLRIAQHPAVWGAVKQTLLERELRHLALTDDLTCLYNRRGFFAVATQLLKLAHRKVQPLLLFFCDLDNLKLINDSYGHQEGDLAIIRVADALERSFREADVIARIGGDEFVVMSLEASGRIEASLLCRLERNLRKASVDESRYKLSLSAGVARFDPKRPISLGELMSRADQAMYEQKRGRSLAREVRTQAAAPSNGNAEAKPHAVAQPATTPTALKPYS
jgi:diguanylate cyclase (GGDEF)-like protein